MSQPSNNSHPLSRKNLLTFAGIDLTVIFLLSFFADMIQILSTGYAIVAFGSVILISCSILLYRVYFYQENVILTLRKELNDSSNHSKNLQSRLEKLKIEFRSRSSVNPRPILVNALVCTKKWEQSPIEIGVSQVTSSILVIDKGNVDGLAYGMHFAVFERGASDCIEICPIDSIQEQAAWLTHSGNLMGQISPDNLVVQVVHPPDIQESEKEIAHILLIADGFG